MEEYDATNITFVNSFNEYDNELFEPSKKFDQDYSIYSAQYEDLCPPKMYSRFDDAKTKAEEIYAIPKNCQNCLGGANLMLFASLTIGEQNEDDFKLYSPMEFGFYRNQSSKCLFNLVKKGDLSMDAFSVNSPASTIIRNNTNRWIDVFIPKKTILEGINISMPPIFTNENISIKIPPKENKPIQINHSPFQSSSGYNPISKIWSCSNCGTSCEYPNHICKCTARGEGCSHFTFSETSSGQFKLTNFFCPDLNIPVNPKEEPIINYCNGTSWW